VTWIVGIDEAGYGPNLGPFVMSSVACRVPDELADKSLWQLLKSAVRRHTVSDTRRLLIDDSKLVYTPARGLEELETAVLAVLPVSVDQHAITLQDLVDQFIPSHATFGPLEPWYCGTTLLPVIADRDKIARGAARLKKAVDCHSMAWGLIRCAIIHTSQFNTLLAKWGSKGGVLADALAEILHAHLSLPPDEPVWFIIDKHGGRNFYAAVLQNALPDGFVIAEREGMERSSYRVLGLGREVRLRFQPRADSEHLCVALASMTSKYFRELMMIEFNRFWQERVPGLKATAGYPGDSERYYVALRPSMEEMGLAEEMVWRRR
jgi:hypothetical protein